MILHAKRFLVMTAALGLAVPAVYAGSLQSASAAVTSDKDAEEQENNAKIIISDNSTVIDKGEQKTLKAAVQNAESDQIKWTSSNKRVATVSSQGVVKAKKQGKCTIKASVKGTKAFSSCSVRVKNYRTYMMKTTAYCNCPICCGSYAGGPTALGTYPKQGRTIAVDRRLIPLGSKVKIGNTTYRAEDTGSAIKGNRIDIYFSNHRAASNYGVRYRQVKVYY